MSVSAGVGGAVRMRLGSRRGFGMRATLEAKCYTALHSLARTSMQVM